MISRALIWLAAGALVLMLCGCALRREQVAIIKPTFSYTDATDGGNASAMWPDPVRDSINVQAALAD